MSAIKGYANQGRVSHPNQSSRENFASVVLTDPKNRAGLDVLPKALYKVDLTVKTAETVNPSDFPGTKNPKLRVVKLTGHSIRRGDVLRFDTGDNIGMEVPVAVTTTDYIFLDGELISDPDGDDFFHTRHITLTIDDDGSLNVTSGPIEIIRDGVSTQIEKDTVDDSNTIGLPVEIVGADGTEINLTAGDINIQSSHTGANPDSMRIGDGTETVNINASNEMQVRDDDANTTLSSIDGKDFATETTLSSIDGKDFATETTLSSIDGKDFATETTLSSLLDQNTRLDIVDSVDGDIIDISSDNIPASSGGYLEIVSSLASDVKEIQVIEDIGEFIGLYVGSASSESFLCVLPQGFTGSKLPISIDAGARLSVRNMKDSTIDTDTRLAINFLG